MEDVFVLLDDCQASAGNPSSRLYTAFAHQRVCTDPQTLDAFWQQVEADMATGLHAAVFADYEWGARLLRAGHQALPQDSGALRVLLFRSLQTLDATAVAAWLAARDGTEEPSAAGVMALEPSVTRTEFAQGIEKILDLIRAGETYQVNYTYRMHGRQFGTPLALYRRLRAMQPVSFGCLAALPHLSAPPRLPSPPYLSSHPAGNSEAQDRSWIVSCSPELFVRNQGGTLTTRPMKGTAARSPDGSINPPDAQATWLSTDPKNLAENVMIVDLLRNDLGRISEIGSVKVPKLFAVETYRTVYQMTSTVESRILPGKGFADVLRALFPCGSITGTPKVHTMDLIAQLETTPRGLYCGAVGWVEPARAGAAVGNFCLSVAIRTLQLGTLQLGTLQLGPLQSDTRPLTLGVGGGVVIDSTQGSEFDETLVKARFLTRLDPGFTLFETLRVRQGQALQVHRHLARLQASAATLGFQCDAVAARQAIKAHVQTLDPALTYRLRLDLSHDGTIALTAAVLDPIASTPVTLVWAPAAVQPAERALLAHKTSLRSGYDAGIRHAMQCAAFDALFVNARGEVTEGGRSSLFVKLDGRWHTPSLQSGALPGITRSRVLQLSKGIVERPIGQSELADAEDMAVCNALRGVLRARLLSASLTPKV